MGMMLSMNFSANGIFGGILSTLYDIISSVFIVAATILIIGTGMVTFLLPYLLASLTCNCIIIVRDDEDGNKRRKGTASF